MTELGELKPLGIAPAWRKRKAIVKDINENIAICSMREAVDYNDRLSPKIPVFDNHPFIPPHPFQL